MAAPRGPRTDEQKELMKVRRGHTDFLRAYVGMDVSNRSEDENQQRLIDAINYVHPKLKRRGREAAEDRSIKIFNFLQENGGSATLMDIFEEFDGIGKDAMENTIKDLIRSEQAWISDNSGEEGVRASAVTYTIESTESAPDDWEGYIYVPRKKRDADGNVIEDEDNDDDGDGDDGDDE